MYLNSRSLLFTGILLAGLLAGLGGFLFFAQMPDAGASQQEVFASIPSQQIRSTEINRIIAERQALAPKPGVAARAQVAATLAADDHPKLEPGKLAARLASSGTADTGEQIAKSPELAAPAASMDGMVAADKPAPPADAKDAPKEKKADSSQRRSDSGEDQYRKGDYQAALRTWQSQAELGDAWAAYRLGMEYLDGHLGVTDRDPIQAAQWLSFAANRNEPHAQSALGALYEKGEGVSQDKVEALKFYLLSERQLGGLPDDERARDVDGPIDPSVRLRAQLTPEQAADAESRAAAFTPIAN